MHTINILAYQLRSIMKNVRVNSSYNKCSPNAVLKCHFSEIDVQVLRRKAADPSVPECSDHSLKEITNHTTH